MRYQLVDKEESIVVDDENQDRVQLQLNTDLHGNAVVFARQNSGQNWLNLVTFTTEGIIKLDINRCVNAFKLGMSDTE